MKIAPGAAMLLCLAAALPAQQAQPATAQLASGRVVDALGKPVAGAVVTLLHRPIPWTDEVGEPDRHRAVTDAEGKFRATLREGRPYSAWAAWQDGATWIE